MKNYDKICISLFYQITQAETAINIFKSFYIHKVK